MDKVEFQRSLPPFRVTLADIGSAGGVHRRWNDFREHLALMLFDPRHQDAHVNLDGVPARCYPFGLGGTTGTRELQVLRFGNMSSLLKPNQKLLKTYYRQGRYSEIMNLVPIEVQTLDSVIAVDKQQVDVIKIDTQGTELEILYGAVGALSTSVLCAEVEISFFERYEGQPLYWQIDRFMANMNFVLIDLFQVRRYYKRNSYGLSKLRLTDTLRSGQIAYANALFVLSDGALSARLHQLPTAERPMTLLKYVFLHIVYGKIEMAAHLFDRFRDALPEEAQPVFDRYFAAVAEISGRPRALTAASR